MQIPVDISLSQVVTDDDTLIFASVRDITERKKTEKKLSKAQKDFQLLVTSLKDYSIIMLDINGNVVTWNSGAEKIKGYREQEIIGKNMEIFYTREDIEKGEPKSNLQKALKQSRLNQKDYACARMAQCFTRMLYLPRSMMIIKICMAMQR